MYIKGVGNYQTTIKLKQSLEIYDRKGCGCGCVNFGKADKILSPLRTPQAGRLRTGRRISVF
jgi:hypothetical protein